ncbi:hypothetical protein HZA97_01930 [Candidatus Woesearchaeota archaeon]|nr:hypothetical protein [Candidatus Woesearchaeota archaeon]
MKKIATICALILSLNSTSCISNKQPVPQNLPQKELVDLNNGYTTEREALRLVYQEAEKLVGKEVKTNNGLYLVNNRKEAIYRLCQITDGIFWYQDPDHNISLEEIKQYIYRGESN